MRRQIKNANESVTIDLKQVTPHETQVRVRRNWYRSDYSRLRKSIAAIRSISFDSRAQARWAETAGRALGGTAR